MKNILATILFCCTLIAATAQEPVIKPQQYKILIERTITHYSDYKCYKYVYCPDPAAMPTIDRKILCFYEPYVNLDRPFPKDDGSSYCLVEDPDCYYQQWIPDRLTFQLFKGGNLQTGTGVEDIYMSSQVPKGTTKTFYDTLSIYQSQFDITSIRLDLSQAEVYPVLDYFGQDYFDVDGHLMHKGAQIFSPAGEFFDQVKTISSDRYLTITRVRVIPNLDPTFTLPSHDRIQMEATGLSSPAAWEYLDTVNQVWTPVPSGHTSGTNGSILTISAYDLFGNSYVDFLHSTVNFRVKNGTSSTHSQSVAFTVRLSSPHITAVTPTNLNCYERHEGSLKIDFDRALLPGEKLNILLFDTLNRVNFSALNITELDANNSYTWRNELRAGVYSVSLLGKYAKGIEYDITVNTRIDTIATYIALNSVNFEEGFDTPETDEFNAFTDYTGYSQATYTGAINHLAFQQLTQPDSIKFAVRVDANVLCKGTASGSVTLAAIGGKGNYRYSIKSQGSEFGDWIDFDENSLGWVNFNPTVSFSGYAVKQIIENLKAGTYTIRVRDQENCYMKDQNGEEKTFIFTVTEPEKGLTVDLFEQSSITAAGASNGKIRLQVSGGTPFPTAGQEIIYPLPYQVEWRDSATNQLINTHMTSFADNTFESVLDNLSGGTYVFRAFDISYNANDPNNAGCYLELIIPVKEPEPLSVTIEQRRQISCNGGDNGELIAKASGGIPIDSTRYLYKWYRSTGEGSILLSSTDSLIENLATGTYLVEITDKYNNTKLSEPFVLSEPTAMQIVFTTTPASCYSSFNGSMEATVTGGTPYTVAASPYLYEWSNGAKTALASNVAGGNYLLVVRDSMNCVASDTVSVTSPVRLLATHTIEEVSCHDTNDGEIVVSIDGGNAPYSYVWSNGNNTATASGLAPGTYWYTIFDNNGCFITDTVALSMPDTLLLDLGPDRVMCIGQTIHLNATVSTTQALTYTWTNPNGIFASSPKVAIRQPGTYDVAVSNSRGCILRDTIQISTIDSVINTDFVVSTQAYAGETVHLINISQPKTDSVKWIVPSIGNTIHVLQQNNSKSEIVFADTGRYEVTMRAYYSSGCMEDSSKTINVINRSGNVLGSQSNAYLTVYAVIFPNPNDGTFKVQLEFSEITSARLRVINTLNNVLVDDRQAQGSKSYLLDYNLSGALTSGTYILVIDAAKGSFVYKVVIVQ